ncbi:unnamed protein product [Dicrocoelium dendriticum]|nr:unnamed protein product [Dicrocoelium dendriticum]
MPCSLSGVMPLPRPLPTPSEFYLAETQPPELPRQPSSDSPTGSTQPWSDSPAVLTQGTDSRPRSQTPTNELVPKRRLGIADEHAGFLRGTRTPAFLRGTSTPGLLRGTRTVD